MKTKRKRGNSLVHNKVSGTSLKDSNKIRSKNKITGSEFSDLTLYHVKHESTLLAKTTIKSLSVDDCNISELMAGPYARIYLAHILNTRIHGSSAIITSLLKNSIVSYSIIDGLNIGRSLISGVAFINVVFHRCSFYNTTFKNCSFVGCTFNRCSFKNYVSDRVPFKNCHFKPWVALGVMHQHYAQYVQYQEIDLLPNRFHKCMGQLFLHNCWASKTGALTVESLPKNFENNLKLSGPVDKEQEDKDEQFIKMMGGYHGPTTYVPEPDEYELENNTYRAYRFYTLGV